MNRDVQTGMYLAEPKWTVFANDSRQGLQQTEGVLLPVTCTDVTASYLPVDVIDGQSFFPVNRSTFLPHASLQTGCFLGWKSTCVEEDTLFLKL